MVLTGEDWLGGTRWTSSGRLGNSSSLPFLSPAARCDVCGHIRTLFWDTGHSKERDKASVPKLSFLVGDGKIERQKYHAREKRTVRETKV